MQENPSKEFFCCAMRDGGLHCNTPVGAPKPSTLLKSNKCKNMVMLFTIEPNQRLIFPLLEHYPYTVLVLIYVGI